MNSEKYKIIKQRFKSLTPVFIGSNDSKKLSPYSDYVQVGDIINIIDSNKLSDLLSKNTDLIDDFVENAGKMDTSKTQSNFSLESFIKNRLHKNIEDLTKEKYKVIGDTGKTIINRFVDSSGRFFLPGSSIKGAFRTALYYYWLKTTDEGKRAMMKLADEIITIYKQKEELEKKKKEVKRLGEQDFKELKNLEKSKFIISQIKKKHIFDESELFGRNENSDAKNLKISDSLFIGKENFSVLNSIRFNMGNSDSDIPVWNIAMNQNTISEFEMSLECNFNNYFLKSLFEKENLFLFEAINSFSKDVISNEIAVFNSTKNGEINDVLSGIVEFYQYLLERINKSKNEYCFLRLGAGKTYYDNSIGLLLLNDQVLNDKIYKDVFVKFKNLLGIGKISRYFNSDSVFPITRSFYNINGSLYPPGWIAIGSDVSKLGFSISSTFVAKEKLDTTNISPDLPKIEKKPVNTVKAKIIKETPKPPMVEIMEGEYCNQKVMMPGVTLAGLDLKVGDEVNVELVINKKTKKLEKANYKNK